MYFIEAEAHCEKQKQTKSHCNIVRKKVGLTSQNKKHQQLKKLHWKMLNW